MTNRTISPSTMIPITMPTIIPVLDDVDGDRGDATGGDTVAAPVIVGNDTCKVATVVFVAAWLATVAFGHCTVICVWVFDAMVRVDGETPRRLASVLRSRVVLTAELFVTVKATWVGASVGFGVGGMAVVGTAVETGRTVCPGARLG